MKKALFILASLMCLGSQIKAQIDPQEYPPGHPNVTVSAIDQLNKFPAPRFKAGFSLHRNYSVMDQIYFGGYHQPGVSDLQAFHNSNTIQEILALNFNYMINITWFDSNYADSCVALANKYPNIPCSTMSLRAQTGGSKMWNQDFPNDHYLQNANGQFLDWSGGITQYPYKTWRPTAPPGDYSSDGDVVAGYFQHSLSRLTRDVQVVNEDGEVYPILENFALQSDPAVVAAKNASGLGWQEYHAKMVRINDNAYRDKFMGLPRFKNAAYTEYRLDGARDYNIRWEQSKYINTPINGKYYSTTDLYVRWPNNWKDWVSAWHGLRWVSQARHYEIAAGDKFASPFVAAGWSCNEEDNVRPAQWLGLLKVMGMYGSEWFYTSFFNENAPVCEAKNYAWQAVMPPYAQGITTQYEDIFLNGSLMAGDMTNNLNYNEGINEPIPYYQFNTGHTNEVVVARQYGTRFAITGTIQNSDNVKGSTPLESTVQINFQGRLLKFKIRRQGSTYVFDATNMATPIWYQVDGWHEATHPWYWSTDYNLEAELFNSSTGIRKTYAPSFPDLTNAKTVVALASNQTADYSMNFRDAATKFLFIKASGTGTLETTFNGSMVPVSIAGEGWYKISLGALGPQGYNMSMKALAALELDSLCITSNPNKYTTIITPPTCDAPTLVGVKNVQANAATVTWKPAANETNGYKIVLTEVLSGQVRVKNEKHNPLQKPFQQYFPDLLNSTMYEAVVYTKCAQGVSGPSQPFRFTTGVTQLMIGRMSPR